MTHYPIGKIGELKNMPCSQHLSCANVRCAIERHSSPSLKTLAIMTEATKLLLRVNVQDGFYMAGFGATTNPLASVKGKQPVSRRACIPGANFG